MDFNQKLEKYAELLLKKGVNLQEGQDLVLNASIDAKEIVEVIVRLAYEKFNAGPVHVNWSYGNLARIKYEHASDDVLVDVPEYSLKKMEELIERRAAMISISASNPDLLKGIDPSRIAMAGKASGLKMMPYRKQILNGDIRWCGAAIASETWAKKVFPDLSSDKAVEKLWSYIFKCTRVDQEDAIKAWDIHLSNLEEKTSFLNEKKFTKLHYKSRKTDLHVDLPEGHIWISGGDPATDGHVFIPNVPTEEIFTTNHKYGVNGTLASTMPLNLRGTLVEDFVLTFKDGKVVDFDAKVGKESLESLLDMDEGAKYLGEVALVPFNSPISNLNTIFYNTLYDENASCHFAFGRAYASCVEGGNDMSDDDLEKAGINNSLVHTDFMVGSNELDIDGYDADGNVTPLFRKGDWAF
ncbi:aminopeptidase [Mycoplasmatota bacterium WC44]